MGRGATAGAGTGTGAGATLGSGKGAGSAAGSGGFPGITISGGRYGNGNGDAAGLHASLAPHVQTSYAMTITSTASSGGGLPDFGIFHNEKVYTVYLDMRANDGDRDPNWTLQYAVLQPEGADPALRIRGTPTPPYATLKQVPICRYVGTRKAAEAATLTNLPLYEATYAPEPIQFYRIKPVAFDSTPGFELNRELRKAGKGHTLDRKKLLLK